MKKATLVSLAEKAKFSISTVSRVLSGQAEKYRISKETVAIIQREAKSANYTPCMIAKGLRTNKTHTIGLLIPSIENPYFSNVASVIIHEAKLNNYTVVVVDTMEDEENERCGLESLIARSVDGIIVVPCGRDAVHLEMINSETPIVLIDRYFSSTTLSYVCTDNFRGAVEATRYFVNNGHRRIACIQGTPHSMPVRERVRGYVSVLEEEGLGANCMVTGENFSIQNGYLETKLALDAAVRPTAIFALSNTIVLGVIKAIKEAALRIPEDVSVLSFDNNTFLDFLNPPITCVSQPIEEIGVLSTRILIQNIGNRSMPVRQILLPPKLVMRQSVAMKLERTMD